MLQEAWHLQHLSTKRRPASLLQTDEPVEDQITPDNPDNKISAAIVPSLAL
jgi:hypothetical protein